MRILTTILNLALFATFGYVFGYHMGYTTPKVDQHAIERAVYEAVMYK